MADQVWLIRFKKNTTDSVSLRFKNSDQDWPSVDLIIYKTDRLGCITANLLLVEGSLYCDMSFQKLE